MKTDTQTPPTLCSLQFGARRVDYRLHRSDRKHLRVVVSPNLAVDVYAPRGAPEQAVCTAVHAKAPWICRALDHVAEYHPLPTPQAYVSGETFVYLGRQYRLRVAQGTPRPARLQGRFLEVTVADKYAAASVRRSVQAWYADRAASVFADHTAKCREIAARHNVREARFSPANRKVRRSLAVIFVDEAR